MLAVWPGLKKEVRDERLVRANERLKVIAEVESIARRREFLEEKFKKIKEIK